MSTETISGGRVMATPSDLQRQMADNASVSYHQPPDARVRKVRAIFDNYPPGRKILDVGCADGEILRPYVQTHQFHGVDICQDLISRAVQNGVKARVHDIATAPLPYGDEEFDVVFSGETIEHQVDTDWFLSELNRVLKPNGELVLTLPNVRTPISLGVMVFLGIPPIFSARYRSGHYRDFTVKVGKIAIENHGFEIVKITGSHFHIPGLGYTASTLASLFPGWADQIIYRAVKRTRSQYSLEDAAKCDIYGLFRKRDTQ